MFHIDIVLACNECEREFSHQVEPTELVGVEPSWSARNIVEAAIRQDWEIDGDEAKCPECFEKELVSRVKWPTIYMADIVK